jgi:PAS domain S-box-containing protein
MTEARTCAPRSSFGGASMADTARARAEAALRHDATLEAVAFAAQRFLETPDWEAIVPQVLRRLGEAVRVSRAAVFLSRRAEGEGRQIVLAHEWLAPGVASMAQARAEVDPEVGAAVFARWEQILARGDIVVGHTRELPEPERAPLASQGVRSILVVPIFVDQEWWGHLAVDVSDDEREWSQVEIDALRAVAGTVGSAISRRRAEEQLAQAEARFRALVERTPAVTYQEVVVEDYRVETSVLYVSPQVERLLGYPAEKWWQTPGFWTQVVHPEDLERVTRESERAGTTGAAYSQEYRMISADGRVVWFHDDAILFRGEGDRPDVWQGVMIDITERKHAEEQLRETEAEFRALVEHIPAVPYRQTVDGDPAHFYIGPQVREVFGYTPQEWNWTPNFWEDRIHPDDRARVNENDLETDRTHEPFSLEYRMRRADGEYIWVQDQASYVEQDDGPDFWQGFIQDITQRKRAEEQLREAEAVYRALVERLPAVTYREGIVATAETLYLSPQVEDMFGYTDQEWRGTPSFWFEHLHPDDADRVREANERANATGEPFAAEYRFRRADGTYVWVLDQASRIAEEDGPGYWQGFIQDITERKEAAAALEEAEARYRTLVETAPAAMYTQVIDQDDPRISKTVYISPQAVELIGYTVEETIADPALWRTIIHPDDRERVWAADAETNETGGPFVDEYRMIAKDGRVVWIRDEATLVRDAEGRPLLWQGFMLDITERKEAEERLEYALRVEREAAERLRALDEMKNTFLQAVSHDLRTPLAAILGLAVTLERADVQLDVEDSRDLARRIAVNARRLDRLVSDLLDLDRLARGIVEPKRHPTDVGALVRHVVEESDLATTRRVVVDAPELVANVDAAKVERIVENLLANTLRHTPSATTVWVRVERADPDVLVAVEDDGPGVPEGHREAIFEPFRQGPGSPEHSPGVGVGLTLVKSFAELLGGRAWVQEREGGGASFRVLLADPPAPPRPGTAG